jgi:hypothetical protein
VIAVGAAADDPQCQIDFGRSRLEQRRAHAKNLSLAHRRLAAVAAFLSGLGL